MKIRLIKHEAVPGCGSYELRFPDGRPSRYVYFEWDRARHRSAGSGFTRAAPI
jgi:hypothetical protein